MSKKNEIKVGDIIYCNDFYIKQKDYKQPMFAVVVGIENQEDTDYIYSCRIRETIYSTSKNNYFVFIPGFSIGEQKLEFVSIEYINCNDRREIVSTGERLRNENIEILERKMIQFLEKKNNRRERHECCLVHLNDYLKKEQKLSIPKTYTKTYVKKII